MSLSPSDIARIVRQHSPMLDAGGRIVLAQAWAPQPFAGNPADRERGRNDALLQQRLDVDRRLDPGRRRHRMHTGTSGSRVLPIN